MFVFKADEHIRYCPNYVTERDNVYIIKHSNYNNNMKLRKIFYLLASLCFVLSACESDDENNGTGDVPNGALPSAEFTPNNLPDEPYAEDAIKIVAEDEDAPFYSIELMGDGHYLLCLTRPAELPTKAVCVDKTANGGFRISKSHKTSAMRTRIVTDENGTTNIGYGNMYYGAFEKIGDRKYRLSNGCEIELQEQSRAIKTIWYSSPDGLVVTIKISIYDNVLDDNTRSLCRTWNYNSIEIWGYVNDAYIVHGKQTIVDGRVEREFESSMSDWEEDDILDDDSELCYKAIFSTNGTYLCFFRDGTAEAYSWEWSDEKSGTIHTWDASEYSLDKQDHLYSKIRFAGRQMRVYNDVSEREDGMTSRSVTVETQTAAQ